MSIRLTRPLRAYALAAVVLGLGAATILPSEVEARTLRGGGSMSLGELRGELVEIGVPVPTGATIARGVSRLAEEAERKRTRFPVAGEFNWGQSGARFGAGRSGHVHEGQDVFAPTGTPLLSVADGVVLETGDDGGRGNYVAIFDPAARRTYFYLHMVEPSRVPAGRRVRAGQPVGGVGCTGPCFGEHLHFEVRRGRDTAGPAEDPLPLLRRWADLAGAGPTLPPGKS